MSDQGTSSLRDGPPELTPIGRRIRLAAPAFRGGEVVLELGTIGAVIAACEVGGTAITEPLAPGGWPFRCSGLHLAPWPNRVRDGRWDLDGDVLQLDITEPERHNALHGFAMFREFSVRALSADRAVLACFVPPQHGWPFALELGAEFQVAGDGPRVTHRVRNVGDRVAPYATSAHPYLRVGEHDVADLELSVPASSFVEVDERLNAVQTAPLDGTRFDLRTPRRVGDLDLDTAYAGVEPEDWVAARLAAPDGSRVELIRDPVYTYVQVYTEPDWPGADGPRTAVAVEPMTAPPDALNSGEGLIWLEPGASWEGTWGLRLVDAGS